MAELHQLREWLAHPVTKELEEGMRKELRIRALDHAGTDYDDDKIVSHHHHLRGMITGAASVFDSARSMIAVAEKEQSANEQKEGVYRAKS